MSNKHFINITGDRELLKQVRGSVPLRNKQVHSDRREKRQDKWWKNPSKWEG
jgi:hypothetical protein